MEQDTLELNPEFELPENFRTLDGEIIVRGENARTNRSDTKLSSLYHFTRLTKSPSVAEIGLFGPPIASLALESDLPIAEHQEKYSVVFFRDALRVCLDLNKYYPKLVETTIKKAAEVQGVSFHAAREEEHGRIAHELRTMDDPIAQRITAEDGWEWPYYGSVDSTPEYIRTIAAYITEHDPQGTILHETYIDRNGETQTIAASLTRAVEWLQTRLSNSALGLLEFKSAIPRGIENQAWKDSWDSYHHANGELANHSRGIASVEVQASAHDALQDAADIYERLLNKVNQAQDMRTLADNIKHTVKEKFWTDDKGGYFVLGLDQDDDGNYRQMKIRTSNMGHLLNSRILDGNDEETVTMRHAILRQLSSPEMLTVSGIRTLASDEVRFREGAYHNGSVWSMDTHIIALGARRHAEDPIMLEFADLLDTRILTSTDVFGSFPEYARGGDTYALNEHIVDVFDTKANRINHVEQPPQEVQAWTVAAILATKRRHGDRLHLFLS